MSAKHLFVNPNPPDYVAYLPAFSRLAAVIVHNCDLNLPESCSSTVKRSSHFRKNSAWTSVRCPAFSSYSSIISSSSVTGILSTVYCQLSTWTWDVLFDIAYSYRRHNTSCTLWHYRLLAARMLDPRSQSHPLAWAQGEGGLEIFVLTSSPQVRFSP